MLTIRPTQALARRLRLALPDVLQPVEKPYADWCVHAFVAARHRYLIAANTTSLLSVVMHARGVTDDGLLVRRSLEALGGYLRGSGREFFHERFIAPEVGGVQFAPVGSRAVLGSINQLVVAAKWFLLKSDLGPFEVADRINQIPLTFLRGLAPVGAFAAMVGEGPTPQ